MISADLYGVSPSDALALAAAAALILVIAVSIPAIRAMRIDPLIAPRHE